MGQARLSTIIRALWSTTHHRFKRRRRALRWLSRWARLTSSPKLSTNLCWLINGILQPKLGILTHMQQCSHNSRWSNWWKLHHLEFQATRTFTICSSPKTQPKCNTIWHLSKFHLSSNKSQRCKTTMNMLSLWAQVALKDTLLRQTRALFTQARTKRKTPTARTVTRLPTRQDHLLTRLTTRPWRPIKSLSRIQTVRSARETFSRIARQSSRPNPVWTNLI